MGGLKLQTSPDDVVRSWIGGSGYAKVGAITHLFAQDVPQTYIADGHHRAASAAKVCAEMRDLGYSITGEESFNYFVTCIFPESQLEILDYNRIVKDLNDDEAVSGILVQLPLGEHVGAEGERTVTEAISPAKDVDA